MSIKNVMKEDIRKSKELLVKVTVCLQRQNIEY